RLRGLSLTVPDGRYRGRRGPTRFGSCRGPVGLDTGVGAGCWSIERPLGRRPGWRPRHRRGSSGLCFALSIGGSRPQSDEPFDPDRRSPILQVAPVIVQPAGCVGSRGRQIEGPTAGIIASSPPSPGGNMGSRVLLLITPLVAAAACMVSPAPAPVQAQEPGRAPAQRQEPARGPGQGQEADRRPGIAVLPFENGGVIGPDKEDFEPLTVGIQQMLLTELAQNPAVRIV